MFNFTTVVFDGTSPNLYFTNTSGWNTSSSNVTNNVKRAMFLNICSSIIVCHSCLIYCWVSDKPSAVQFVTGIWEDVKIYIQIAEYWMRLNYKADLFLTGWLITTVCQFCDSRCVSCWLQFGSYIVLSRILKDRITVTNIYRGADKSLARLTSRCILFDVENISFDASLVIYIYK